jgi:Fe2+ or Zn2+ uptake regulation protein
MDSEAIKNSLEGGGLRCTPQRYAVMAFLIEHTGILRLRKSTKL